MQAPTRIAKRQNGTEHNKQGEMYVVCNCVVQAQLIGEKVSEWLESTAENCSLVPKFPERGAELSGTWRDGNDGLELVKYICRCSFEKSYPSFKRSLKV